MDRKPRDESNTSLVSVEDMINSAILIGKNRVDYKMIQAILHLMAHQMRLLKSQVDLRICDSVHKVKKKMEDISSSTCSSISSSDSPRRRAKKEMKKREKKEKAIRVAKTAEKEAKAAAADKDAGQEGTEKGKKKRKMQYEGKDDKELTCGEAELLDLSEETITGVKHLGPKVQAGKAKDKIEIGKETLGIAKTKDITAKKKEEIDVSSDQEGVEKDKWSLTTKESKQLRKKDKSRKGKVDVKEGEEEKSQERESDIKFRKREEGEGTGAEYEEGGEKKRQKGKKEGRVTGERDTELTKGKEKRVKKKSKDGVSVEDAEESTDEEQRAKYRDKKEKRGKMTSEAEIEKEARKKEKERVSKMSKAERKQYEKDSEFAEVSETSSEEGYKSEKGKEKKKTDKMSPEEREKYRKEKKISKGKLGIISQQKDVYESEEDRGKMEKRGKKSTKEREKYEEEIDKEIEKIKKMSPKEREKYEETAEREKMDKMSSKERERYEKDKKKEKEKIEKMSPKEKEQYEREKRERELFEKVRDKYEEKAEREKMEKMSPKERERYEKDKKKEKEKIEKMSPKEKEQYEREKREKEMRRAERVASDTGISIKESVRKGEKIIVVEKGPSTYGTGRVPRVGSVECVTRSEFELLEAMVNNLKKKAGPLPMPAMPDNKRLLDDIASGSASLTDTMEAMQMAARLQAAETAIERMAGLLTQLAASGALPKDVVKKIGAVTAGLQFVGNGGTETGVQRKNVNIDSATIKSMTDDATSILKPAIRRTSAGSTLGYGRQAEGRASVSSQASTYATVLVTRNDLGDAIDALTEKMKSYLGGDLAKTQLNCEAATAAVKAMEEKMVIAMKLGGRLTTLNSLVNDYSQQLHGFDAGLATQMTGFQEQMTYLRRDLTGGLTQLEKANNNAESEALSELNDRYQTLVNDLDSTLNDHGKLNMLQNQLGDELRSLVTTVETLREQKADRDEVLDGLRDKADTSRMKELVTEKAFDAARHGLEDQLENCYQKFHKQENVWMEAIKDISEMSTHKAELMMLLAVKDNAQTQLREMQERLAQLALALGEPMAAIVTRNVSKNATCGPCMVPALQGAVEPSYGVPHTLPQARPAPLGQEELCTKDVRPPHPPDDRPHTCHRWVGGSHTLVTEAVRRVQAPSTVVSERHGPPVKIYPGQGTDGRLYVMETRMVPCDECHECCRERLPNEEPLRTTHVEVCLGGDNDKKVMDEGPPGGDGAGDAGG